MTEPTKAASAASPQKFRYTTVAPGTIRVTVSDLSPAIPADVWCGDAADFGREVALPCAEIFPTSIPRIRLTRLSELLPGCIEAGPDAPEWIDLPTGVLARAYHPVTLRERIEEPVLVPEVAAEKPEPADETPAPSGKPPLDGPPLVVIEKRVPGWKRILKPILGPSHAELEERYQALRAEKAAAAKLLSDGEFVTSEELLMTSDQPESEFPIALERALAPAPVDIPALALADAPIVAASELQDILMTEDDLTIRRVVELSAALPGLRGCLLTIGSETISSGGLPGGVGILPLRERAKMMLADARAPGVSLLPALTFYSDAGPVSFLAHEKLDLMIVHRDRGFLPGVREKLGDVLEAIARQVA